MPGFKHFQRDDNESGQIFRRDDGTTWMVTGYITDPAVCLRRVDGLDQTHVEVIGCRNSMEFRRMEPVDD